MKNKHLLSIIGLMLCSAVYAADDFPEDLPEDEFAEDDLLFDEEEILISATGYSRPTRLAPSVATVITAAEIKEMGATTLFEALESVPGLHVYPMWNLLAPAISIRGIQTGQGQEVLVLRNGQPIKDPTVGNAPGPFRAPVANIARIEVIRGPGSAVHGADAFAGVINIITKDAHEIDGIHIGSRTGSFNSNSAWIQYGKKHAEWDIAFNLEHMRTGGDPDRMVDVDAAPDPARSYAPGRLETRYEYFETSLYLRNDNWDIDFWHWQQRNGGTGPGVAQALDPIGNEDHQYYQFDISYTFKNLFHGWELKPHFSYVYQDMQRNFVILPPGTGSFTNGMIGRPGYEDQTYTINFTGTYTGFEKHMLRIDAGYSRQEMDSIEIKNFDENFAPLASGITDVTDTTLVYTPDTDRERHFLSIQDEWRISKEWIFTAGLRYDYYSDSGKTINPRFALIWSPPIPLTTKLLFGSAFRAPSISEMYIQNNPVTLGKPNLDPETINTLELAFEYFPLLELNSRLSLFYYEMNDTIEIVATNVSGINQYDNTAGQRAYGFEVEIEWDITNHLALRSNFAWQHAERKDDESRVGKTPGREFHFAANWEFMPLWAINMQINWVGGIKRPSNDSRGKINSFAFVDFTLRKQTQNRSWEFALSAKNIFDKQAFEWADLTFPGDYELQGRSVYAEASYHFR